MITSSSILADSPKFYIINGLNKTEISNEGILNKIKNGDNIDNIYEYINENRYKNLVKYSQAETNYYGKLMADNNIRTPDKLREYLKSHPLDEKQVVDGILENNGVVLDLASPNVPELKEGSHYSRPAPGSKANTSLIYEINLGPNTSLKYFIDESDSIIVDNDLLERDLQTISPQVDFQTKYNSYLYLLAVESKNEIQNIVSYKKILIDDSMINLELKEAVEKDLVDSIVAGQEYGHGLLKIDSDGTYYYSILSEKPEVYQNSKFNSSKKYEGQVDLKLYTDSELDNINDKKKYVLIYELADGLIKNYQLIQVDEAMVKVFEKAEELQTTLEFEKGSKANTSKLTSVSGSDYTRIKYTMGDLPSLFKDRDFPGGIDYKLKEDIKLELGDKLNFIFLNEKGKVLGYKTVVFDENMKDKIKSPTAPSISFVNDMSLPSKGNLAGNSRIEKIRDGDFRYLVSDEPLSFELNGQLDTSTTKIEKNTNIKILDNANLLEFNKFLNIFLLEDNSIKKHSSIPMNTGNVKMKQLDKLPSKFNPKLVKGNYPSTFTIEGLDKIGLDSGQNFKWTNIKTNVKYDYGDNISNLRDISSSTPMVAKLYEYVAIFIVDSKNRPVYQTNIQLTLENIGADYAPQLVEFTEYSTPIPADEANSTMFSYLAEGVSKYKLASEKNSNPYFLDQNIKGLIDLKANTPIKIDRKKDKYISIFRLDGNKLKAYKEIQVKDEYLKDEPAPELLDINYEILPGTRPGSIKLKLNTNGLEGSSLNWKYKIISQDEIPSLNKPLNGAQTYLSTNEGIGQDIIIKKGDQLLLIITQNNNVKYYKILTIEDQPHAFAPDIDGLKVIKANKIDRLKLNKDGDFRYSLSSKPLDRPGLNADLNNSIYSAFKQYDSREGIIASPGQILSVLKLDSNSKIIGFSYLMVQEDMINRAKASFLYNYIVEEAQINTGGYKIEIELTEGSFNPLTDKIKTDIINGISSDNQADALETLKSSLRSDLNSFFLSNDSKTLTILLAESPSYNISNIQELSFKLASGSILDGINPVEVSGQVQVHPSITAKIAGDFANSVVREDDIKNGTVNLIIELTDGAWTSDISGLNLFPSGEEVKQTGVTRNNARKATIGIHNKDINLNFKTFEKQLIINKDLVVNAREDITVNPNFKIYPTIIRGDISSNVSDFKLIPPKYNSLDGNGEFIITSNSGSLKNDLSLRDFAITGLPSGMKLDLVKQNGSEISFKLTGSSSRISGPMNIVLKGSGLKEPGSLDSNPIAINFNKIDSILDKLTPDIDVKAKNISGLSYNNEYRIDVSIDNRATWLDQNSSNFLNGTYENLNFTPGPIYIRDNKYKDDIKQIVILKEESLPRNIEVESVSYESNKAKYTIKDGSKYEYSINNGSNWADYSDPIKIDNSQTIILRSPATKYLLPSKGTASVNGVFLGNIDYDVSNGKLMATNSNMEYSLNSNDGIDGNWYSGSNTETLVDFREGQSIWIRDKKLRSNGIKLLDTISRTDQVEDEDYDYDIFNGKIIGDTGDIEFRIGSSNWANIPEKIQFTPGSLEIRRKGDKTKLASNPVKIEDIAKPAPMAKLEVDDDKKEVYYFEGTNKKPLDNDFEYKLGLDGEFKDGSGLKDDSNLKNADVLIVIRRKAKLKELPSESVNINFTKNISLDNLDINVAEKTISGTNNKMEYRFSNSSGIFGPWTKVNSDKINFVPVEKMKIQFREANKPSTIVDIFASGLERNSPPNKDEIEYHILNTTIRNKKPIDLEYEIGNSNVWSHLEANTTKTGVNFTAGEFYIRAKATKDKMESLKVAKGPIKAPKSGPNISVSVNEVDNSIIGDINSLEYKYDNKAWIDGSLIGSEDFTRGKKVEFRTKATKTELPSQIKTIEFVEVINLTQVNISTHIEPHELNGTSSNMEYRLIKKDSSENIEKVLINWKECSNGNTILPDWLGESIEKASSSHIEIRQKNKPLNFYSIDLNN